MHGSDALTIETLEQPGPRRQEAMRLLLSGRGDSALDADAQLRRLEEHAANQSLRLGTVLGASLGGRLVSAVMVIEAPGRLGSIFVPAARTSGLQSDATVALLLRVQQHAWQGSLVILQALLDQGDREQAALLAAADFQMLAELIFMERTALDPCPRLDVFEDLEFVTYTPKSEALFSEVLELTYQHSRDCPKLTGLRRADEILATHRATGLHDPTCWLIAKLDGQLAGVLLLAGVHERHAFEVVYMGVAPAFRGRGLGHAILRRAVDICRQRERADLTLAVDTGNEPARRLYRRWAFREVTRRCAWFAANPRRTPGR